MDDERKHFHEILRNFDTAVLVTHDGVRTLRARPMAIAEITESGDLWFLTDTQSAKVHEIETDSTVQIICQKGHSLFVSLTGRADLIHDRAQIDKLWKESYKVWFPKGKSDPAICLIQVRPEGAEYWDNSGMKSLKYAVQTFRAYVKGERPVVEEGKQHGTVQLK